MAEQAEVGSWQPSTAICVGSYIVMLLLSLDGFHSAEIAAKGHGWYMKFIIGVPWAFAFIAGVAMLVAAKRKLLNNRTVGLWFVVGLLVSAAYDGMGKLADLIH